MAHLLYKNVAFKICAIVCHKCGIHCYQLYIYISIYYILIYYNGRVVFAKHKDWLEPMNMLYIYIDTPQQDLINDAPAVWSDLYTANNQNIYI